MCVHMSSTVCVYCCVCVSYSCADAVRTSFSGLRIWCHELFHLYIHVSATWMNSAALCYVDKPTVKRTPETLTHQLNSFILPLTVFNLSRYYFKWHKDQKYIQL